MWAGQPGWDGDDPAAERRSACPGVLVAGQDAGRAQQVVGDRRAQDPGGIGAEATRGQVCQRSVDQIGEHGLDDGVVAVGDVGLLDGQLRVGEERVIPPHREQRVAVAGVLDPAHHRAGGDRIGGGREGGVGDFGDFGIRDPLTGVGIDDRAGIAHRCPGVAFRVITNENCAPCRTHAATTARLP